MSDLASTSEKDGGLTAEQVEAAARALCIAKGINPDAAHYGTSDSDVFDDVTEKGQTFYWGWRNQVKYVLPALEAYRALASPAPAESGEPADAWQHRLFYEDTGKWSEWRPGKFEMLVANRHEERPLYLHPPAESAGSPSTSGIGVLEEAATKLIAHWDSMSGPEKRGEFEGVGYWSPAGRMVSTEFIVELRAALSSRDTQPALLSTDETKEGGNG